MQVSLWLDRDQLFSRIADSSLENCYTWEQTTIEAQPSSNIESLRDLPGGPVNRTWLEDYLVGAAGVGVRAFGGGDQKDGEVKFLESFDGTDLNKPITDQGKQMGWIDREIQEIDIANRFFPILN